MTSLSVKKTGNRAVGERTQPHVTGLGVRSIGLAESDYRSVQCCFTSTETTRTIRDGEPRMATSTFTQPLSSSQFNATLRPQRP